jgi:hypothetical protein
MIYSYAPGRGGKHAAALLEGFSGILRVDGYDGYNILKRNNFAIGLARWRLVGTDHQAASATG